MLLCAQVDRREGSAEKKTKWKNRLINFVTFTVFLTWPVLLFQRTSNNSTRLCLIKLHLPTTIFKLSKYTVRPSLLNLRYMGREDTQSARACVARAWVLTRNWIQIHCLAYIFDSPMAGVSLLSCIVYFTCLSMRVSVSIQFSIQHSVCFFG